MSADNYLYVYSHEGKFYVEMLSASCDYSDMVKDADDESDWEEPYPLSPEHSVEFDNLADAIEYASNESGGEYPDHWTEYGWSMSPKLQAPSYADLLRQEQTALKERLAAAREDHTYEGVI